MAYAADPDCFKSYRGEPRAVQDEMQARRVACLKRASQDAYDQSVACAFTKRENDFRGCI